MSESQSRIDFCILPCLSDTFEIEWVRKYGVNTFWFCAKNYLIIMAIIFMCKWYLGGINPLFGKAEQIDFYQLESERCQHYKQWKLFCIMKGWLLTAESDHGRYLFHALVSSGDESKTTVQEIE